MWQNPGTYKGSMGTTLLKSLTSSTLVLNLPWPIGAVMGCILLIVTCRCWHSVNYTNGLCETWIMVVCYFSGDVPRVNGQLAVSRAFGDKSLKSHLRSDPDVQDTNVDMNTDVLILASDGLWKVILVFVANFIWILTCISKQLNWLIKSGNV